MYPPHANRDYVVSKIEILYSPRDTFPAGKKNIRSTSQTWIVEPRTKFAGKFNHTSPLSFVSAAFKAMLMLTYRLMYDSVILQRLVLLSCYWSWSYPFAIIIIYLTHQSSTKTKACVFTVVVKYYCCAIAITMNINDKHRINLRTVFRNHALYVYVFVLHSIRCSENDSLMNALVN